jgi:hypothetical protein
MKNKHKITIILLIIHLSVSAQSWYPVGSGITGSNNTVIALTQDTLNNLLYAAGAFTTAGSNTGLNIAKWNGTSWSALGTGIPTGTGVFVNSYVASLAMYDGKLFAGGFFNQVGNIYTTCIGQWNGSGWDSVGSGISASFGGTVFALAVFNNELYVGGTFYDAGGNPANGIARWNGTSWSTVGTGVGIGGMNYGVRSFAIYDSALYVGGIFPTAGGITANGIAKWDGNNWSSVGTGVSTGAARGVYSLAVYNNELFAGGYFTTAGGISANNIAKWNGAVWDSVGSGTNSVTYALAVYNGELYAGGAFNITGGLTVNKIAKWDGITWSSVSNGMSGAGGAGVNALAVYNNELYVGGLFAMAGATSVNNIAKWNSVTTNIEKYSNNSTLIYPNPSNGQIKINTSNDIEEIKISNTIGQIIYLSKNNGREFNLQLEHSGIYFLQTTDINKNIINAKIIVE